MSSITVTSRIETPKWFRQQLSIPVMLGEVCLWNYLSEGVGCSPDIFETTPLSSLRPLLQSMKNENAVLAYVYSYPVITGLNTFCIEDSLVCHLSSQYKHYYINTSGEFKQYLDSKNKKTVSTLKRKVKKLEALNGRDDWFSVYSTPIEFEVFFELAMPVSDKSYQERLLKQGLPKTEQFKKNIISKSEKGEVLGYILKLDGKPVAYTLCPVYGGNKVLYHHSGYDPDYSAYSPGTVLQYKIIEDIFGKDEIDFYDLCTGEAIHKEMFATGYIYCANIYLFKIFSRITLIYSFDLLLSLFTSFIKKLLDKAGLKNVVKKYIRRSP